MKRIEIILTLIISIIVMSACSTSSNKSTNSAPANDNDFKKYDVVKFEFGDVDYSSGYWKTEVKYTNIGDQPLKGVGYSVSYLDKEGNTLFTDDRYWEEALMPGKSITKYSMFSDEDLNEAALETLAIFKYEYRLPQKDSNGHNWYEIDKQLETVDFYTAN